MAVHHPKTPRPSSLTAEVGALIRAAREHARLTQQEVADRTGRSLQMIGRIERGAAAPSFETLQALSDALGTPVAAFFQVGAHVAGSGSNKVLARIVDRLSRLDADDLEWADEMLKVAMRRKGRAS